MSQDSVHRVAPMMLDSLSRSYKVPMGSPEAAAIIRDVGRRLNPNYDAQRAALEMAVAPKQRVSKRRTMPCQECGALTVVVDIRHVAVCRACKPDYEERLRKIRSLRRTERGDTDATFDE